MVREKHGGELNVLNEFDGAVKHRAYLIDVWSGLVYHGV
jgi:hypothetical protein